MRISSVLAIVATTAVYAFGSSAAESQDALVALGGATDGSAAAEWAPGGGSNLAESESSAANEDSSAAKEDSSAATEDSSAANEDSSAANEDSSAANEDSSAANEDSSAANEDSSAANEDSSAANEDSSAANEDSSAANEDSSAASEDAPSASPAPAPTTSATPTVRAVHIHVKYQPLPRALESLCADSEDEMSVEGVEGVFCVKKGVGCSGDRAWGKCPGRQTGLPHGSYCGRVATGVFGCKPGMPYGEVPDWDDLDDRDDASGDNGSGVGSEATDATGSEATDATGSEATDATGSSGHA